jgi:hypothetical protein
MQTLATFPRDEEVVSTALEAIRSLSQEKELNNGRLGELGAVNAVVQAMMKFTSNGLVQVRSHSPQIPYNLDSNGAGVWCDGLRQARALSALSTLSAFNAANKKAVGDLGAAGLILQAMETFPGEPLVQEQGWTCIRNLATGRAEPLPPQPPVISADAMLSPMLSPRRRGQQAAVGRGGRGFGGQRDPPGVPERCGGGAGAGRHLQHGGQQPGERQGLRGSRPLHHHRQRHER